MHVIALADRFENDRRRGYAMTPLAKNILRGVAMILLIMAAWGSFAAVGMFHKGENETLLGRIVIWSSWAALLLALIAIASALFRPRASARFALAGLIAALPLTFVAVYPRSWCWAMECGPEAAHPAFVINGLLILVLFGLPAWLLRKV